MVSKKSAFLTKEVLEAHFHLPMAEVAKKFGVCVTYFKNCCRMNGVMRWPFRQVSSMKKRKVRETVSPQKILIPRPYDALSSQQGSQDTLSCGSCDTDSQSESADERCHKAGIKRSREPCSASSPMDILALVALNNPHSDDIMEPEMFAHKRPTVVGSHRSAFSSHPSLSSTFSSAFSTAAFTEKTGLKSLPDNMSMPPVSSLLASYLSGGQPNHGMVLDKFEIVYAAPEHPGVALHADQSKSIWHEYTDTQQRIMLHTQHMH